MSPNLTTLFIKGSRHSSCLSLCSEFQFPTSLQSHLNKPIMSSCGKQGTIPSRSQRDCIPQPLVFHSASVWPSHGLVCCLPHVNMWLINGCWLHLASVRGHVFGHTLRVGIIPSPVGLWGGDWNTSNKTPTVGGTDAGGRGHGAVRGVRWTGSTSDGLEHCTGNHMTVATPGQ